MTDPACPWDIRVDDCALMWRGRRLSVRITLTNRSGVARIPEPRRLRPTLRDVRNHALAVSDIFRTDMDMLTVFRPVIQPGASIQVRLQFERLPHDRAPEVLTFGEASGWSLPLTLSAPVAVAVA